MSLPVAGEVCPYVIASSWRGLPCIVLKFGILERYLLSLVCGKSNCHALEPNLAGELYIILYFADSE